MPGGFKQAMRRFFSPGRTLSLALAALLAAAPGDSALADTTAPAPRIHHPHFFRVLNQGGELEFYGEIVAGVANEFAALLKANPHATIIHLNSEGGSVREARRMSAMVNAARLRAITDKYCYSACVLVFLGADERYMTPDAEIGFHHESAPGASTDEIRASEKIDEDFMARRGLPEHFLERAFSTPASQIWTPTLSELTAANVVSGVRSDFAVAGFPGKTAGEQVNAMLAESHVFTALRTADPKRFTAIRTSFVEAIQRQSSYGRFSALYDQLSGGIVDDYLVKASDDLMVEFAAAEIALMREVVAKDPAGCSLIPDGSGGFSLHMESDGSVDYGHFNEVKARAVKDGAAHPVAAPSRSLLDTAVAALHLAFRARYPDQVDPMKDLSADKLAPGAACTALADYLDSSLTLPRAEAAAFLRYNYASEAPPPETQPASDIVPSRSTGKKKSD
jgi:hypothetical protein